MDFTPITEGLLDLAPLAVAALGAVIAAALSVTAIKWGYPLVVGFFRKNAK